MLTLVIGGSGSGKSNFAEERIVSCHTGRRIYLATMLLRDHECEQRVLRHREMRAGKSFETIECPRGLEHVSLPPASAVLLEDLSNLTANEFFSDSGASGAFDRVINGIRHLNQTARALVIVSNELFSDGMDYDDVTTDYLHCLSALNVAIAAMSDHVYEVVCGIPIRWKGACS